MLPRHLMLRETSLLPPERLRHYHQVNERVVERLSLECELSGHKGCVNCIQWNRSGDLLLSGSDDLNVGLWDPHRKKSLKLFNTLHKGNIFSVKFLPHSQDGLIVSGAADSSIHVLDLNKDQTIQSFYEHFGRVKRLDVAQTEPHLIWSAAEDGIIMQMDMRREQSSVLVNLNATLGKHAEAKCVSVNPVRNQFIAVGANDPYVTIYDRRMIKPQKLPPRENGYQNSFERKQMLTTLSHFTLDEDAPPNSSLLQYFIAGHLPSRSKKARQRMRSLTATYVTFSSDGTELLVNLGGEQIYLFSLTSPSANFLNDDAVVAFSTASLKEESDLDSVTQRLKDLGNASYEKKAFSQAIAQYNKALLRRKHPVLYCNRAAALMKRNWDGDMYAALRDCRRAVEMDRTYVKAHLRMMRCYLELDLANKSQSYMQWFHEKFSEESTSTHCVALEDDICRKLRNEGKPGDSIEKTGHLDADNDPGYWTLETRLKQEAADYSATFCGHCNTTTDIKEANFFGEGGQYITAGSDDGHFFLWDKASTNILRVFKGDESIVNCLQSHPSSSLLASSGIEPVIRLWAPHPEDGSENDDGAVRDYEAVASANQRRMNEDPFETLLLNLGYEMGPGSRDDEDDDDQDNERIQCRTS